MSIGQLQVIVTCIPGYSTTEYPCPAGSHQSTTTAYVLDQSYSAQVEASLGAFDYEYAAQIWFLGFSSVVGLYLACHGIGVVLDMFRHK